MFENTHPIPNCRLAGLPVGLAPGASPKMPMSHSSANRAPANCALDWVLGSPRLFADGRAHRSRSVT